MMEAGESGTVYVVFARKHSGEPEQVGLAVTRGWAQLVADTLALTDEYASVWVEERPLPDYLEDLRAGRE